MNVTKFVSNFDFVLFVVVILLSLVGILFIYSANINKIDYKANPDIFPNHLKQVIFFIINLFFLFAILFLPSKFIIKYALFFYIICLTGLLLTLFFPLIKGQKRLNVSFFSFQFSEFMKIATILLLSNYYYNQSGESIKKLTTYLIAVLFICVPAFLILLQPDLGTVLVYFPILLVISFFANVRKRYLLYSVLLLFVISFFPVITSINKMFFNNENEIINILSNAKYLIIIYTSLSITLIMALLVSFDIIKGVSGKIKNIFYWILFFSSIVLIGLLLSFIFNNYILDDYQKDRIMIFFNPNFDPEVRGYHILQSQVTIGNGGLAGKGFCKGEMIQKLFLPEHDTDFIYPVIAEEKGFLGSLFIMFLYSLLFFRAVYITLNVRYYWESYVIIGILTMYLYHILQNIGMTIGIMPITGIPLPFLSYGGSFLTTCYLGIAIIMNIHLNRYQF